MPELRRGTRGVSVPQLVATIGPASLSFVAAVRAAGATAFRLNASHVDTTVLGETLRAIRRDAPGQPVIVDLQGAKMRLGSFRPVDIAAGERVRFSLRADGGLPVPHREFFEQTKTGETIGIDDGRLRFTVASRGAAVIETIALNDGRLQPRKGVNLVEHPVELRELTGADREAIRVSRDAGVNDFAFSFMTDGREAAWLRSSAPGCRVTGKVERREAAASLDAIASRVDSVWICRGDLAVQLGDAALARAVAAVDPRRLAVPALMAGQVLEHLTHHPFATRSEVCHLFDLLARGYEGVVLSDESAVGIDPVGAVRTAARLLAELSCG